MSRLVWALVCLPFLAAAPAPAQLVFEPAADATLYEDGAGALANGSGDYLFAGYGNAPKRTLLRFDLTSIPPGTPVESVELTLEMSRTISPDFQFALHRVTTSWSEGPSDALGQEGAGIVSEPGDATWLHTDFPTTTWANPGGDFAAAPSAAVEVDTLGSYTWGPTPEMLADVQGWVDDPSSNDGWILVGPEVPMTFSAKRFNSRQHPDVGSRPRLQVGVAAVDEIPTLDPAALLVLALLTAASGWWLAGRRG